jgi:RNA polymerase sigma-70 factor (TIGR02960 family)
MLGSIDDAEDAVQETLLRAWRGRAAFEPGSSLRAWLYRIATNVCLDAIGRRRRGGRSAGTPIAVGPLPDDTADPPADATAGPEARYDTHEAISLAFATVLQQLPPRQRAVLILRDVLSWHAQEVADLLEISNPAVTSALHRARSTMVRQYHPSGAARVQERTPSGDGQSSVGRRPAPAVLRSLLDRYVRAWESADVSGLVALLREEAVLAMPPGLEVVGRDAIGDFFAESIFIPGRELRVREVRANGVPAFVVYARTSRVGPFAAFTVILLEVGPEGIGRIDAFRDPGLIRRFGLPEQLDR